MAAQFAHAMPFGAEYRPDGATRFRFYGPRIDRPGLVLSNGGSERTVLLDAEGDGWFGAVVPDCPPGTRYAFTLPDGMRVPDPASRFQPDGVHAPSEIVDPLVFQWESGAWRGRPWHEAVVYELHVGTYSQPGDYDGVRRRLDYLATLGVTAVELMPLSSFDGRRNWGYDGVYPFAPFAGYGRPDDLKQLVDEAHGRGMMVLLDVVYNHFGPEGNYLHAYAEDMFTDAWETPWGKAIDFSNRAVRDFFIHNALYWLNEYRFDGLRFDAVQEIHDAGEPHMLDEMALALRSGVEDGRHIHLVLENDANQARYLERDEAGRPRLYDSQWNDDFHHVLHHLVTGETGGYYRDFTERPMDRLANTLARGFGYQGEPSPFRDGAVRGTDSSHLGPLAFVQFIQNHDQIGNRAFGERLGHLADDDRVMALATLYLLLPSPPLLFMGEEWGASTPFLFFCDFHDELADSVREGRRAEFQRFPEFADPKVRERIPDPNAIDTFEQSCLDWTEIETEPHRGWLETYRRLLATRRDELVPRLDGGRVAPATTVERVGERGLTAAWTLPGGEIWRLRANLGDDPIDGLAQPGGRLIAASRPELTTGILTGRLAGYTVEWTLEDGR